MKNTYLVKSNENDECRLEFLDGDNEGKLFVYISELTSCKLKSKVKVLHMGHDGIGLSKSIVM